MRRFHKPMSRGNRSIERSPVTSELVAALRARDGRCVAHRIDPSHVCRDQWGTPHAPNAVSRLTVEHVKSELRMSKRADSDLEHTVLLCYGANVGVPSKQLRASLREYLATVNAEPEHAHVDPTPGCSECVTAFGRKAS